MERYICIHGHFYQPPRENPWLESIELQDSAYPFHDWNERISAECYGPNAASRILDGECRIAKIVNNYSRINFNFGPTLLAWMEARDPELYEAILEADRESIKRYSGHGSAIAQAYNHMIMPLANERDKYTQVRWGIRDFEFRFGRRPEGMWLPETAVDLETLHVLAEEGVTYTILAQYQAHRVRGKGNRKWVDVLGGHVDPTMPYEINLKSGKSLTLFFYDGPISRGIAFERLLMRGEDFAGRLLSAFKPDRTWPQLVNIATDGETYGHHHAHGDMALAYALDYIESKGHAKLTNYGEFLEKHPPTHQVEIVENTAWSCAHGIDRWRADCGCNSGGRAGWSQAWRAPLREALDWLRDALIAPYHDKAAEYLVDPWQARDEYVAVVLNRWPEGVRRFIKRNAKRELEHDEETVVLKLLELQRHAMLMYTSCGWFFDELTGIETVQVIQYAGRVVQLARELFDHDFESGFLERLERARSNIAEHRDGKAIYQKWVKPSIVDLSKVAAHYAVSTLFEDYGEEAIVYCYQVDREDYRLLESGRARLAVGRAKITSRVTQEVTDLSFACLHLGDHNLACGVEPLPSENDYHAMVEDVTGAFARADFPETIRRIDRRFGESAYSLKSLFRDEQRKILNQILQGTLAGAEGVYRQLYQNQTPLMRFLADLGVPLPTAFKTAAEVILNSDLRKALTDDEPDLPRIQGLLEQVGTWKVQLDTAGLGYTLGQLVEHVTHDFEEEPHNVPSMLRLEETIDLVRPLPFKVDLSMPQNVYYKLLNGVYRHSQQAAAQGDEGARLWVHQFQELGRKLSIRVSS